MSPIVTQTTTHEPMIINYPKIIWSEDKIPNASAITKEHVGLRSVYSIFITTTILLALFFTASLVLTIIGQYFLDWGSALLGLLGSTGLAFVGWFSKRQVQRS
ncbi:hypothetical protein ES703_62529 [subsurface metagenome]